MGAPNMARDMARLDGQDAPASGDAHDRAADREGPAFSSPTTNPMRLRISLSLEIEAADFVEAAAHQRCLQAHLERMQETYPEMALDFWERRRRVQARATDGLRGIRSYTGRLSRYRSE